MHKHKQDGRILKTGHYAGLKFEEGWFFTHILDTEYVELKPWILLNEDEERDEIAPHTAGSTDDEIVDHVERQLVEPRSSEQNLLFQLHLGVAPSRIQIFPFFGRDRAPNLTGGAEPGKPQVYLNGYDSPFNDPSPQSEIITVNSMDNLALQAYNPMDEPQEAKMSFHVNKMKYAVVEDVSLMKAMIQGQVPFRDHSMGLAAQRKEQIKAPSWLNDKFGDVILSTQEILRHGETEEAAERVDERIPDIQAGGVN